MSLKPQPLNPIPELTARIARTAFPKGNPYMRMRDELGVFYHDELFGSLFPNNGQPALAPWRLALVTVFQFAEGLSDRQAAEQVRSRIDWKYALSLELDDSGFDFSVLSEFRDRLLQGSKEHLLFETMLTEFKARGLLKARGSQRTDSTHVLAKLRALNRLEGVHETLRAALNTLAVVVPEWLQSWVPPEWYQSYEKRLDEFRFPKTQSEQEALAQKVGQDGLVLFKTLYQDPELNWLTKIPAVEIMRRVWVQQYQMTGEVFQWRANDNLPPSALFINSPYDPQAHYAKKRSTSWVGYKVHLSESCEEDGPHLITNIATSIACKADDACTSELHASLAEKKLLPQEHLVDTGYLDAELMVSSKEEWGVKLIGPSRGDYRWQARAGQGFEAANFRIDWEKQQAICPVGKESSSWTPAIDRQHNAVIKIKFSVKDCGSCAHLGDCTKSARGRRGITIRPQAHYEALQQRRSEEGERGFKEKYAKRAGAEGTISQGVRSFGMRRSRYQGIAKTHLQHLATGAALNLVRVIAWLEEKPLAKTRTSRFAALAPVA